METEEEIREIATFNYRKVICTKNGTYRGKKFYKGEIYPIIGHDNGEEMAYRFDIMLLVSNGGYDLVEASMDDDKNYPEFSYVTTEDTTPSILKTPRLQQLVEDLEENIIQKIDSPISRIRFIDLVRYLKSLEEYDLPF